MTNEVGRLRSDEVQSKTTLNSVSTLFILIAIVALVGWMAWVVIGALAPVVGIFFLIFFGIFNIWVLLKVKRITYSSEEKQKIFIQHNLDEFNEKMVKRGKEPWTKEGLRTMYLIIFTFLMLIHLSEAMLFIIYASQEQFQHLPLNYLGFAAIAAAVYFVSRWFKSLQIISDGHYCRDTSRTHWVATKVLPLIVVAYIGGILLTILGVV